MSERIVVATLRDTRTGHVGQVVYPYDGDYPDEAILYHWLEGNYSCDCNRALFLHDDAAMPCNGGEPQIQLVRLEVDGKELWEGKG